MKLDSRVVVTGAKGMVGRSVVAGLKKRGYKNIIELTRKECDLENGAEVERVWNEIKPEYVFHIAAKVGGIKANMSHPVEFLENNLLNEVYVMRACHKVNVKRLLFLGSSCIYPRECPQPMKEEYLMTGPLEPTNEGYALAKIAGLRLGEAYAKQYGMNFVSPMPCNIYGPGDSFDLEHSHVLSALVRRFMEAKKNDAPDVTLWGTGSARREFIYTDDATDGIIFCMENEKVPTLVNLGTGQEFTIKDLAIKIAGIVGYTGELKWDTTKPDGMPRKCLDVTRMRGFGWEAKVGIDQGIKNVVADYEARFVGPGAKGK